MLLHFKARSQRPCSFLSPSWTLTPPCSEGPQPSLLKDERQRRQRCLVNSAIIAEPTTSQPTSWWNCLRKYVPLVSLCFLLSLLEKQPILRCSHLFHVKLREANSSQCTLSFRHFSTASSSNRVKVSQSLWATWFFGSVYSTIHHSHQSGLRSRPLHCSSSPRHGVHVHIMPLPLLITDD